jgi:hypothetical protein
MYLFQDIPCTQSDLSAFIPTYSPIIKNLLEKGEIFKEWDKFIEETAYFILSRPMKFESRGIYADFGRLMYQRYPCIGHQECSDPWVSRIACTFCNIYNVYSI